MNRIDKLIYAAIFALSASSLVVDGTFAATTAQGSTSTERLDPKDPDAAKKCTDGGGTVSTDKDGNKVCTLRKRGTPDVNPPGH